MGFISGLVEFDIGVWSLTRTTEILEGAVLCRVHIIEPFRLCTNL